MTFVRVIGLALLAAAGGCSSDASGAGDAGVAPSIECGDDLCGGDQYCVNECLCCGIPTDAAPSSRSECRPIPAGCDPDDLCSCASLAPGSCDAEHRVVAIPCA